MLVTAKELADALEVSIGQVRKLAREEVIPAERVGRSYQFDLDKAKRAFWDRRVREVVPQDGDKPAILFDYPKNKHIRAPAWHADWLPWLVMREDDHEPIVNVYVFWVQSCWGPPDSGSIQIERDMTRDEIEHLIKRYADDVRNIGTLTRRNRVSGPLWRELARQNAWQWGWDDKVEEYIDSHDWLAAHFRRLGEDELPLSNRNSWLKNREFEDEDY